MPQAAQTDYLKLAADLGELTAGQIDTIERWHTHGVLLDAVITDESEEKQLHVTGFDWSADTPLIYLGDKAYAVANIVSVSVDDVTAKVGEELETSSVAENDLVKVKFSSKLPVGTYTGSIKVTAETISSVSFVIADEASDTMQVAVTSAQATKLSSTNVEKVTIALNDGSVVGSFLVPEGD